jgi:hypothetical protein
VDAKPHSDLGTLREYLAGAGFLPQHTPMLALARLEEQLEAARVTLQLIDAACRNTTIQGSGALLAADIRAHIRALDSSPARVPSTYCIVHGYSGCSCDKTSNQESQP